MLPDALSVTLEGKLELPSNVFAALQLMITSTGHIKDVSTLHKAMLTHVHVNALDGRPTALSRLNRVFGRAAKRVGTSTRDAAMYLLADELLTAMPNNTGKVGLIPTVLWNELPSFLAQQGIVEGSEQFYATLDAWVCNTVT